VEAATDLSAVDQVFMPYTLIAIPS